MSGAVDNSPKIIPWWECLVDSPSKIEPPEWLPFQHALQQRSDRVGSGTLAARDLLTWLGDGQLPSAIRLINSKGQETSARLLTKFWQQGALSGVNDDADFTRVHFRDSSFDGDGYIFVRADVFGRLNASASAPAPSKEPRNIPPRRRGPVLKHDWHAICGEIARRCHNKSGQVVVPKSESKLADDVLGWCEETDTPSPAVSEMREAVKAICAALRKV
jgi:hypothetical protein